MKILIILVSMVAISIWGCESKEIKENEKKVPVQKNAAEKIVGYYKGIAKNDTPMELTIERVFNNEVFGYNIISWNINKPLRSDFIGVYDSLSNRITINEDNSVKGAGYFEGFFLENGSSLEGTWYRYSDNGSYKWSLKKTNF